MTQWGLDTLFNPAKRHMDEEKRRLQSTREEVGDSSGGKRIDLESGRVTIRKPDAGEPDEVDQPDEPAAADEADEPAAAESSEHEPAGTKAERAAERKTAQKKPADDKPAEKKAKREMTPAAQRAAERRARLRK
jgi:hypothetical protein